MLTLRLFCSPLNLPHAAICIWYLRDSFVELTSRFLKSVAFCDTLLHRSRMLDPDFHTCIHSLLALESLCNDFLFDVTTYFWTCNSKCCLLLHQANQCSFIIQECSRHFLRNSQVSFCSKQSTVRAPGRQRLKEVCRHVRLIGDTGQKPRNVK